MQIGSKSRCMDQIRPLYLLADTSLTAPETGAYFSSTFDLSNSI